MLKTTALLAALLLALPTVRGQTTKDAELEDRVINGVDATSCPYQARLQATVNGASSLCGAVVIAESYVLTAAHCVDNGDQLGQSVQDTFAVTAGTLKRSSGGTTRSADRVYIHPNWDKSNVAAEQGYDMAILHLSSPFPIGSSISIIDIATSNPSAGASVRVTGWGSTLAYAEGTSGTSQLSENLKEATLTVLSESQVNSWFTAKGGKFGCNNAADVAATYNFNGVIATGNDQGTVYDACQGDSGGPIAQLINGNYQLVGTVSHGYGCGQSGLPSFQTSAVNSRSWIQEVIAGVSGITICNGRTCGPGAECSGNTCVCKSGYSLAMGYSNMFGYTCQRWLNGGAIQRIDGYNSMYQVVPSSNEWNNKIIRGFSAPLQVNTLVTACGYNFYPRSSTEASTVASQLTTYASSAGAGNPSGSAIWTAIGQNSDSQWRIFQSMTATIPITTALWASGEPTGGACATMATSGSNVGQWDAVACSTQTWYIIRYITTNNVASGNGQASAAVVLLPAVWLPLSALTLLVAWMA